MFTARYNLHFYVEFTIIFDFEGSKSLSPSLCNFILVSISSYVLHMNI